MTQEILQLDITELAAKMNRRELSAAAIAEAVCAEVIAQQNLNAVLDYDADVLRRQAMAADDARAAGTAGPLAGIPLIIKDNINTNNLKTTAGTGALKDFVPVDNAPVVDALVKAGAIIAAKANMHELAFGITSNNAVTGAVHNPQNKDLIPGGSSGGTAAAIAAGIFPAGLGTDTGGSCRIPAALCGITGYRPSSGRYDTSGCVPISTTRDTPGPMARSVADIRLLDAVMAGVDVETSLPDAADITLGVVTEVFFDNLEPAVDAAMKEALDRLAGAGCKIVEISLADIWGPNEAFSFPVVFYEVMRALPDYLGTYAPDISMDDLVAGIASPDVVGAIASQLGDEAMPEEAYRAAMEQHRPFMIDLYERTLVEAGVDAIVFPTTPLTARPIGEDETVNLNGQDLPTFPTYIRNTDLGSNIGAPGISLPLPVTGGMPVGLELDGLPGRDGRLLGIAARVERILGGDHA